MNQMYDKVINPIVKALLRSPAHRLLSKNTMLLDFKGRKTGRLFCTPVSYSERDGRLHCFTSREYKWWRNLVGENREVRMRLRGQSVVGKVTVFVDQPGVMAEALTAFLMAVPRDAAHTGVRLDENRHPNPDDVVESARNLVYLSIEPSRTRTPPSFA